MKNESQTEQPQNEQPQAGHPAAEQSQAEQPEVVEVHNVWTIYGVNGDGSLADRPVAQFSRPQDWGNSKKWVYHLFRFEWLTPGDGKRYVNNCHCWTDLQLDEPGRYPELFRDLIIQVLIPGHPAQLCGREYLALDDFWRKSWGEMPPLYDADGDDWYDGDDGEQE